MGRSAAQPLSGYFFLHFLIAAFFFAGLLRNFFFAFFMH